MSGSRPAKLLYSPGVQSFVAVLTRLKDAPDSDTSSKGTALTTMLANFVTVLGEVADEETPAELEADFEEALERTEEMANSAFTGPEGDWRGPMREFSQLRLAKKIPQVLDKLLPWEKVFPAELASSSGVTQVEVREAIIAFAGAINLQEIVTWSEDEVKEAMDLVERNEVLKEVFEKLDKFLEEGWQGVVGSATAFASFVLLAPVLVFGLLVSACISALGGGDSVSNAPIPADVGTMPLYKLGGSI